MELLSGEGRNLPITKCCLHKKKERKTVLGAAGFSPKAPSRFKMRWPVHPPAPQQARSSPAGPELRQEPIPPCRPPEPMPSGAARGGLSVLGPGSGLHRSARQGWFGLRAKQRFPPTLLKMTSRLCSVAPKSQPPHCALHVLALLGTGRQDGHSRTPCTRISHLAARSQSHSCHLA